METNVCNTIEKVKITVEQKFNDIRAALHMREKLLLRQLDVISNSQQMPGCGGTISPCGVKPNKNSNEINFITEQENELFAAIRSFGRFQLDNINLALQDLYLKNEDYIEPADDHETMYKCLQQENGDNDLEKENSSEAIVVDFSRNKSLVEDNAKLMNKSIINITLQEAKELIRKAKIKRETYVPPLNLEELDDELESSIAEAVSSLGREPSKSSTTNTCVEQQTKPKSKKSRFKPKITINNCNGTINLRNIASLTINCANEETVSAKIPLEAATEAPSKAQSVESSITEQSASTSAATTTTSTTASSSNYSSTASSRSQSKKQKLGKKSRQSEPTKVTATTNTTITTTTDPTSSNYYGTDNVYAVDDDGEIIADEDTHEVTCDFYNRLLSEIKKSLQEKPTRTYDPATHTQASSTCNSNVSNMRDRSDRSSTQVQPGRKLILKNFENLKIILEANSGDEDTFHPVQIEQWLAEIISETDLEPMQNTDILEHSKINTESN